MGIPAAAVHSSGPARLDRVARRQAAQMYATQPLPEPAADLLTPGRALSRGPLLALGVTDAQIERLVRCGVLDPLGRGRYLVASSSPDPSQLAAHDQRLRSYVERYPDMVVAGRSAALRRDLPVHTFPPRPELIRHPEFTRPDGAHLRRVCLGEHEFDDVGGMPVTTVTRTVADLLLSLPPDEAAVSADAALHRGLTTRDRIGWALRDRGPVRGIRRARYTLTLLDERSESPLESFSRLRLVMSGVPRPWVNPWLRLPGGWVRPDTLWWELGIVGEADGRVKYADDGLGGSPLWAEKLRQEAMESCGLLVLRWTNDEIHRRPGDVVNRWNRLAARRAVEPWTPPPGLEVDRTATHRPG